MPYNPKIHHRRSIRLRGFDYSSEGVYFLTVCTEGRVCMFGEVIGGKMRLNEGGEFVEKCWKEIPEHFPFIRLDEFVVMPDHVHGILFIRANDKPSQPLRSSESSPTCVAIDSSESLPTCVGANNHSPQRQSQPRPTFQYQQANNHSPLPTCQPRPTFQYQRANNHSPRRRPNGTSKTIGSVIRGFKIGITKWYRFSNPAAKIWQRDYYERIVHGDEELNRIRYYIKNNPGQWEQDSLA